MLTRFSQKTKKEKIILGCGFALISILTLMLIFNFPLASGDAQQTIKNVLGSMVNIIGTVFQAVGVILAVYSVGQLVLAFKNEDADSKSRASTMLVVGVVLIAIPSLIKALDLVNQISVNI
jgi:fumarate reductase subunit D